MGNKEKAPADQVIAQRIKEARQKKGLSLRGLASLIVGKDGLDHGVTEGTIRNWEKGSFHVDSFYLQQLAKILDVDYWYLTNVDGVVNHSREILNNFDPTNQKSEEEIRTDYIKDIKKMLKNTDTKTLVFIYQLLLKK